MVEINEIEFIEEPEYFKLQHGSCFCMLEEEKKRKENFSSEEKKLSNSNFTISNAKQKGLYFFNKNLNVFSLSDFLYKVDNENSKDSSDKINIKSQPFEENVLLIENNKTDTQAFLYTDQQNIYMFDYGSEKVKLHCRVDVPVRGLKHIGDDLFLVLSTDEQVHLMRNKQLYECQEWTDRVNNIDEKNGVFLFTYSNKEMFILKDHQKSNTYDLSNISKEIDICHEKCNIMCAKILEAQKNRRTLFLMVLYEYEEELTTIMYDLQIEEDKIKRVTYSTNDFDFQNFEKNYVKCIYISEWQTVVAISSESCEAVIYTRNGNMTWDGSVAQPMKADSNAAEWDMSSGLKFLSVMEGYKINTRDSETFFLSLFMYTKYEDKIYRKSKIGNVPFLKNPCVFFALQDNHKIVVEYLDKYKLVDNTDLSTNVVEEGDGNECGMKEVTVLPDLKQDVIEVHEPVSSNVFNIFKVKEKVTLNRMDPAKGNEEIMETKKESFFDLFRSKVKFSEDKADDGNVKSTNEQVPPGKEVTSVVGQQCGVNIEMDKTCKVTPMQNDPHEKDRKNELAKKRQHLYRCIRRSAKVYEDESFIVNELPDGFNKLIKSGIYFYEEFLNHLNVHSIERRKDSKMGSRKKECYYDKGVDKIVFLRDSVIGEDVDEVREEDDEEAKKKKKIPKRNNKNEFHHHFHCEDFDFYKHKKLSDRQCERIIKKIERKQGFLRDIKGIFFSEDEDPNDGAKRNDKSEKTTLPPHKDEPTKDPWNRDIQIHISNEERTKFYQHLDSYFSKRKLLKVRKEIFNELKNDQLGSGQIFETILYNIFKQDGMKHCEAFIYFVLKNLEVKIFSSSFFLLELYFAHLLSPYFIRNKTNIRPSYGQTNAPSIKLPSLKGLLGTPFSGANRGSAHPTCDNKEQPPLDSEYSTDDISEDDLLKKIKNEKDFSKKNEYFSKVIPLFKEPTSRENESISFHLMHAGIHFANKRMCHALSQKLFPILVDSRLNKMDDELGLIKNYLHDVVLSSS